jgi:Nuclear fragile X mental retardation-interacting protein 1 (NUFIP1)/Zinc finger C-x8-C-x5-C-x3-H type (and similar)
MLRLSFEYKGKTSTLGSNDDILKWIEERKKKWPTKQRIEEKDKERTQQLAARRAAVEASRKPAQPTLSQPSKEKTAKDKLREAKELVRKDKEERRERKRYKKDQKIMELRAGHTAQNSGGRQAPEVVAVHPGTLSTSRTENEMYSAPATIQNAETSEWNWIDASRSKLSEDVVMKDVDATDVTEKGKPADPNNDVEDSLHKSGPVSDVSLTDFSQGSSSDDSSNHSDSDSDISDSDSAPEETSSRSKGATYQPPKKEPHDPPSKDKVCHKFVRGQCKRGGKCHYSHDREMVTKAKEEWKEKKKSEPPREKEGRKGLYQRMVEQEEETHRALVLSAIKFLGECGHLNADA